MIHNVLIRGERDEASLADFCSRARGLRFKAVALRIGPAEPLTLETPDAECTAMRAAIEAAHLRIAALFPTFDPACHFGSRAEEVRHQAIDRAKAALDLAARFRAETVVVQPAAVAGTPDALSDPGSYADALNGTHFALQRLRYHAERCGVTLGLIAPGDRFLLSPVEFRELIDEEHVPCVSACIDLDAVAAVGRADDWIHILAPRICCIRAANPAGTHGWHLTRRALEEVGYTGPICSTAPQALARGTPVA